MMMLCTISISLHRNFRDGKSTRDQRGNHTDSNVIAIRYTSTDLKPYRILTERNVISFTSWFCCVQER